MIEDLQGHPQCLKKDTTQGFPLDLGNCSFGEVGAFAPTSGAGDVKRVLGDNQELTSCCKVILAVASKGRKIEGGRVIILSTSEGGEAVHRSYVVVGGRRGVACRARLR
jgi:hypothetical protein